MTRRTTRCVTTEAFAACAVVISLAVLAHVAEWAIGRSPRRRSGARTARRRSASAPAPRERSRAPQGVRPSAGDGAGEARADETAGRIGVALTVVAAVLHIARRAPRPRHRPVAGAVGQHVRVHPGRDARVTLIYLALLRRSSCAGWACSSPASRSSCSCSPADARQPAGPLVPALHSYWLVIHVVAAILATGAFAVGG